MSYRVKHADYVGRGPSPLLWADCPEADIRNDMTIGYYFEDDFTDLPTGKYTATQAGSAGTFSLTAGAGGIVVADAGDEDDGDGINVQKNGALFIPSTSSKIWFETRLKHQTALTTPADFFVGLSEVDGSIIASSANTSANHIGFQCVTENGVLIFVTEKASSAGSIAAVKTFTAATYVKLGFKVTNNTLVELFVDGEKFATTFTDSADIPIVEMTLSLVCQAASTPAGSGSGPAIHMDWWRAYQLLVAP